MSAAGLAVVLVAVAVGLALTPRLYRALDAWHYRAVGDWMALARATGVEVGVTTGAQWAQVEAELARQDLLDDRIALHELDDRQLFAELTRPR